MENEHFDRGIRARAAEQLVRRTMFGAALSLALLCTVRVIAPAQAHAQTSTAQCGSDYDPSASYPTLPEPRGADVVDEAGFVLFVHEQRAVVELDGCLFAVDRPLGVEFDDLDFVTVLVELPDHVAGGATVFVTEDGVWTETLEVAGSFSYVLGSDHAIGFEIAAPGQELPTIPVVVNRPTGGNPG